jgi:protein CpxP
MMKRFRMLTAAALVAGLTMGGAAYAQGPGGRGFRGRLARPGGPGGLGGLPIRALDLTDAQKDQVRAIRERHADDLRAAQDRLRKAVDAARKVAETIPVNEGLIRATIQDQAEAQTDVAIEQSRLLSDTWAVLTPAQQARVRTLQQQRDTRQARARGRQQQRQN